MSFVCAVVRDYRHMVSVDKVYGQRGLVIRLKGMNNMGLFYNVQPKKLFEVRNEIFVRNGIPALKKNGFKESPYKGMRFGKLDAGTYAFDYAD